MALSLAGEHQTLKLMLRVIWECACMQAAQQGLSDEDFTAVLQVVGRLKR